jgi:sugar fermentation stimulation protein A
MMFPTLHAGRLVQRYKRFLADIEMESGDVVTAHVANSGSMLGLCAPGSRVYLSRSEVATRKLAWSWELVEDRGVLVGINTSRPNGIVEEGLRQGALPMLDGYATVRREVKYGFNSRIDLLLEDPALGRCFVEVKSVTLSREPGLAEFPDARTTRGAKHLTELAGEVAAGNRAVMLYLVQRGDCDRFRIAADIDPAYAAGLEAALAAGVEIVIAVADITPSGITLAPAHPPVRKGDAWQILR